jgi:hypothetical protein
MFPTSLSSKAGRAALAFAAVSAAFSCGAPTGEPVGFEPPEAPLTKVTLYPEDVTWHDAHYDVYVPTGRHYRLAVGSWGGFRSRALVRFELGDIPKEIPIEKITSVLLKLPYLRDSGYLNDDYYSYGDVQIDVHPLRRDFDEDRATWWRRTRKHNWTAEGGDYGPAAASIMVGDPSYRKTYLTADITAVALDWMANPYRNYGLLLKASNEDAEPGIKEFYSTNAQVEGYAPRLEITYIDDETGEKAYRILVPEKDSFITLYDGEYGGNEVHGRDEFLDFGSFNGYGRRALFYFDLSPSHSGIPKTASIARARLRLYYSPAGRDEQVFVAVYRLTAPFDENARQDVLEMQKFHDNLAYVSREFKQEPAGYIDLYVNPLIQEWVSGKFPNYGLMIKAPDESKAQAFPRLGAKDNPAPDRRPYLEIEYSLPPSPWFTTPK